MTARLLVTGIASPDGLYVRQGDGFRRVEPTRTPIAQLTPLGLAVREACAAILAGELRPCRWCGSISPCDCERWREYMLLQNADPHGDLSQFSDEEIPY